MTGLSSLGAASAGVWTRSDALRVASVGTVRAALRDGTWQVVWPGVYADGGYLLSAEQRGWAAVLATGLRGRQGPLSAERLALAGPVACGRTAARFWGLPLVDDADPATGSWEQALDDVTVGHHAPTVVHDGRVLRRHRLRLTSEDVVRTLTGPPVTSPLRTLVDGVRLLEADAAVCALDDALHRRLVDQADLERAVALRAGTPGGRALRRAVSAADGRSESCGETLTRLLVLPVLPSLEPQVELRDGDGVLVARFDLGDRTRRLAVETDGKLAHGGPAMVAKDRARDLRTERYGWWTERVTWFDVRCRQRETLARLQHRVAVLDGQRQDGSSRSA